MHTHLALDPGHAGPCFHICVTVIRIIATALLMSGTQAFAACEQESALLCSSGDPRCLEDAANWVAQAAGDCKTPQGRLQNAAMWQAAPQFFDGEPHEHVFWRCIARLCDAPQDPFNQK